MSEKAKKTRAFCILALENGCPPAPGCRTIPEMKTILPWVFVVLLAVAVIAQYAGGRKQETELTQLREESAELQKLRAASEQTKTASTAGDSDELTQLRKDHEDLLRLRNEIRQLRDEKAQLTKQLQSASAAPQQQLSPQQLQQLQSENSQLKAQAMLVNATNQMNACINNLRQIENAKQQWAAANGRPAGSLVNAPDIAQFFPNKAVPSCPAGGIYTINPVGINPICNMPAHVIPR